MAIVLISCGSPFQVLRAVTTNGDQLLVVSGAMCILIYFFAVWAFYSFPSDAWRDSEYCSSLSTCFASLLWKLSEGHLNGLIENVDLGRYRFSQYANQVNALYSSRIVSVALLHTACEFSMCLTCTRTRNALSHTWRSQYALPANATRSHTPSDGV